MSQPLTLGQTALKRDYFVLSNDTGEITDVVADTNRNGVLEADIDRPVATPEAARYLFLNTGLKMDVLKRLNVVRLGGPLATFAASFQTLRVSCNNQSVEGLNQSQFKLQEQGRKLGLSESEINEAIGTLGLPALYSYFIQQARKSPEADNHLVRLPGAGNRYALAFETFQEQARIAGRAAGKNPAVVEKEIFEIFPPKALLKLYRISLLNILKTLPDQREAFKAATEKARPVVRTEIEALLSLGEHCIAEVDKLRPDDNVDLEEFVMMGRQILDLTRNLISPVDYNPFFPS